MAPPKYRITSKAPMSGDGRLFHLLEAQAICPLPVGLTDDAVGSIGGRSRVALGPFLPPSLLGREVSLEYLKPKYLSPIFLPSLKNAQNWDAEKDLYCFPASGKLIMEEWICRLDNVLSDKWATLGIRKLIFLSTKHMLMNPRVCSALLAFWNHNVNCFLLPEGPMSITLEDIEFLTGCFPSGEAPRLTHQEGDKFFFNNHRITKTLMKYERQKGEELLDMEEFDFYLEWLSKYIFCNSGKQATNYMVALSNHLCRAKGPQAFGPFLLSLVYRSFYDASRHGGPFPYRPAGGPCWLLYLWAHLHFPTLAPNYEPRWYTPEVSPHFCDGDEIGQLCVRDNWVRLTVTGCIANILDEGRVRERRWRRIPTNHPLQKSREAAQTSERWSSILTARDLMGIGPNGLFFEFYNPQLCARQLGFVQEAAIPLSRTFNASLNERTAISPEHILDVLSEVPPVQPVIFPSRDFAIGCSRGFQRCWDKTWAALSGEIHYVKSCKEPISLPPALNSKAAFDAAGPSRAPPRKKQKVRNKGAACAPAVLSPIVHHEGSSPTPIHSEEPAEDSDSHPLSPSANVGEGSRGTLSASLSVSDPVESPSLQSCTPKTSPDGATSTPRPPRFKRTVGKRPTTIFIDTSEDTAVPIELPSTPSVQNVPVVEPHAAEDPSEAVRSLPVPPYESTIVGPPQHVEQPPRCSQPLSLKELVSQLGETLRMESPNEESFRQLQRLLASLEEFTPLSVDLDNVRLLLRAEYWHSWEDYAAALRHQSEVERRQQASPAETTSAANQECQELQTQIGEIEQQLHATQQELCRLQLEEKRLSDQLSFAQEALLAAEERNEEVCRAETRRLSQCYLDADRLVIRDTTRRIVLGKISRLLDRM